MSKILRTVNKVNVQNNNFGTENEKKILKTIEYYMSTFNVSIKVDYKSLQDLFSI